MERRFQGVVARPFILYEQSDATSLGIRDSTTTAIDSYDSESYGEEEVSGCCRTDFSIVLKNTTSQGITDSPTTGTATTTVNRMERLFQGIVAWPFILTE